MKVQRPLKIGIFSDCYLPTKNGVVSAICESKAALERQGHQVLVFTVAMPGAADHDPTVIRFPSLPFQRSIETRFALVDQRRIEQTIHAARLDLLHSHTEFSLGWAARRAARRLGLPLVHTAHTMYEAYLHYLPLGKYWAGPLLAPYWRWFLRYHSALICPSAKSQALAAQYAPHLPTMVIPNGMDVRAFGQQTPPPDRLQGLRKQFGLQLADRVMLFVGRLAPEKRLFPLLAALSPLLQRRPNYKLLLVGSGPHHQRLRRWIAKQRLEQQILLAGALPRAQMPHVYALAHVLLSASLSEIHPFSFIEAQSCGLPIIARRDIAFIDLVEDGVNGYLVADDAALAERAGQVLQDESLRRHLAHQARRSALRFAIEEHVSQLLALYRRLIASPSEHRAPLLAGCVPGFWEM